METKNLIDRIVVIDTETASLDIKNPRMCELAAVEVIRDSSPLFQDLHERHQTFYGSTRGPWFLGRTFQTLSSDDLPIEPETSAIHHIVDRDVAGAPSRSDAVRQMCEYLGLDRVPSPVLCAHNAAFDEAAVAVLRGARWVCTWKVSKHVYPTFPSRSLQALRYRLKLDPPVPRDLAPHRALYDAICGAELLQHMLLSRSPDELLALTARPWIPPVCPLKKHRGKPWGEVPRDYIRWMLSVPDMDPELHLAAKIALGLVPPLPPLPPLSPLPPLPDMDAAAGVST